MSPPAQTASELLTCDVAAEIARLGYPYFVLRGSCCRAWLLEAFPVKDKGFWANFGHGKTRCTAMVLPAGVGDGGHGGWVERVTGKG